MRSSSFIRSAAYWSHYLVIRWQFIISMLVIWWVSFWLRSEYGGDDSNLWIVMNQFLLLIQWTILALFLISLLTAAIPWVLFIYGVRNHRISALLQFGDGQRAVAGWVPLNITLKGIVIRPLLGTVRARLVFAEKKFSDPILLDSNLRRKGNLFRYAINGKGETLLHDRGIYDVEKIHILFCDMFNLIALPFTIPFTQQLFTLPLEQQAGEVKAQPHTTEMQEQRIELPRRVEGEYINYKEFESGDNIRRIVWKIYAKSGQLVVRIPETRDPYASHLYFYASFFTGADLEGGMFANELLNVYKDKVRNLFEALQRNGFHIRIPQDQEVPKLSGMGDRNNELFQITAAHWQNNNPPVSFISPTKAAFVCLSSLTPVAEVEEVLKRLTLSVPVVVVKMSEAIPSPFAIKLQHLFFSPEKQPSDKLRQPWLLSPLRRSILKNEKEIQQALERRGNGWMVSSIEIAA